MNPTEFLNLIVAAIVEKTDAISIEEKHDDLGILLMLKVDPSDMGAIIGRGGKTIESIRTILRVFGSKREERVNLRIIEEDKKIEA